MNDLDIPILENEEMWSQRVIDERQSENRFVLWCLSIWFLSNLIVVFLYVILK